MFIQKEDLYKSIREHELDEITGNDDMLVKHAINSAISEVKVYLQKRYDTEAVFSVQGENRNSLIVSFTVDIALYEIVAIALPGQNLDDRRARYKRAIDYLKQVLDGNISPDLPEQGNENYSEGESTGGNPARNNYF